MRNVDHRQFKDELYGELARVGAALASPKRLEMLDLLAQRERSVEDLAGELGLSIANASRHLRVLAQARLVETRRAGTFAHYRLASPTVLRVLRLLGEAAEERLPEVRATLDRHLGARSVDKTEPRAIARLVKRGRALLVDVRPEAEYRTGHIAGSRNIPIELLARKRNAPELPRGKEIVVYCRGPYCVWADEAVELLQHRGFSARRLLLGAPDWALLGEALEKTAG
jgi:DNA-binding transcriptional ArsR family regulator